MRAEQEAAWSKARSLAEQAGLSLEQALSILDGSAEEGAEAGRYDGADWDWMQKWAARSRKQRAGRRRAAARRRSEAGFRAWHDHPMEQALHKALRDHDVADMALFWGELQPKTVEAIRDAIPWPNTMREAIAEEAKWNEIETARKAQDANYRLEDGPWIRRSMLREHLEGDAASPEDMAARAKWLATRIEREAVSASEQEDWLRRTADDLAKMLSMLDETKAAARSSQGLSDGSQQATSNKEKRERVRAILAEPGGEGLSLRELARRAGVSVQGAANMKAALAAERVNA